MTTTTYPAKGPMAVSTTKFTPAVGKPFPSTPEMVQPSLRFMLEPEAMADAEAFYSRLANHIAWTNIPDRLRMSFVEKQLIITMPERWPYVARANEVVDGLLADALRVYAANPKFPGWWISPAICLMNGRPQHLAEACRKVLQYAGAMNPERYQEERTDHILKAAVRHWQDRDLPEFEGKDP